MTKNTIYGSVSMTTTQATPTWIRVADESGNLPPGIYNQTLKDALVFLGWDTTKGGYTKERSLHIRSNSCPSVIYKTNVFRFPVRDTYEFKRVYEKLDILHIGEELFAGWNNTHIKLADFGNEEQPPTEGFNGTVEGEA